MNKLDELIARLPALQEKARQRAAQERQSAPAKVVQLPLWPDPVRGVPNGFLRSALFGAIRRGRRRLLQREKIHSVDGVDILQTGPRLDQADLDVWEQCLHLSRTAPGTRIQFAAHSFLKAIGRSAGGKDVEWLKCALARLASTVIEFKDGKRAYFGPMIHHGARDDESGRYVIEINPAIARLYGSDGWTAIEFEQRLKLKGQPLAQWLHGFYSTHAEPYPYSVERLRELCGSEVARLRDFRAELRDALAALAAATSWQCTIDEKDLVHVVKAGSPAQQRHKLRKQLGRRGHSTGTG